MGDHPTVTVEQAIARLREMANPADLEGMARFGIATENSLGGIRIPELRRLAKEIGKDHALAEGLWASGYREARFLACLVDDPKQVTEAQLDSWVLDLNSWDVCDSCCGALFDKTPFSYRKALEWGSREEEFVKRAGFALMAFLTIHDKKAPDEQIAQFLPAIKREATDGRNYVKKAVNWALREIGKRNRRLNVLAIGAAQEIKNEGSRSGRWIASDALRELMSEAVQGRIKDKG